MTTRRERTSSVDFGPILLSWLVMAGLWLLAARDREEAEQRAIEAEAQVTVLTDSTAELNARIRFEEEELAGFGLRCFVAAPK